MDELRVGSFFSGIGAFEKALERLEIPHRTVFYCEIDKYASKTYSLIHNVPESFNLWDITKVDEKELPDFDLMTWGFPCQDISVAGKQKGVIEGETRSGLYYDGLRILKAKTPKYSIIENVKNLTSEKFMSIFHQILCDLEDAGYHSYYEVLNAKDYGIPQNRERIFIVSIRKDVDDGFMFPLPFDNGLRLKDLLEDEVDEKYYISQEKTDKLLESLKEKDVKHLKEPPYMIQTPDFQVCNMQGPRVKDSSDYSFTLRANESFAHGVVTPCINTKMNTVQVRTDGLCCTLISSMYKEPPQVAIQINQGELKIKQDDICICIDANYHKGMDNHAARTGLLYLGNLMPSGEKNSSVPGRVYDSSGLCPTIRTPTGGLTEPITCHNYRIRKLTPLECFRLMGFDDADYWLCKNAGISDSQLYRQAGNSIVVQVLEGILNNLLLQSGSQPDYFYEQLALFG